MTTPRRRRRDWEQPGQIPAVGPTRALPQPDGHAGPSQDTIAQRAYELYQARGAEPGHDWDDWLRAERELQDTGAA